jgi:hypothetical protein
LIEKWRNNTRLLAPNESPLTVCFISLKRFFLIDTALTFYF